MVPPLRFLPGLAGGLLLAYPRKSAIERRKAVRWLRSAIVGNRSP